jgi:hypothetical protein
MWAEVCAVMNAAEGWGVEEEVVGEDSRFVVR